MVFTIQKYANAVKWQLQKYDTSVTFIHGIPGYFIKYGGRQQDKLCKASVKINTDKLKACTCRIMTFFYMLGIHRTK